MDPKEKFEEGELFVFVFEVTKSWSIYINSLTVMAN